MAGKILMREKVGMMLDGAVSVKVLGLIKEGRKWTRRWWTVYGAACTRNFSLN